MAIQSILTSTSLVLSNDGRDTITFTRDHLNYKDALSLYQQGSKDFQSYKNLHSQSGLSLDDTSDGKIVISGGRVTYKGKPVSKVVGEALIRYKYQGLPTGAIESFLKNLSQNPSLRSREQLWPFMENHKMALTEDGCFLAYKSVRSDMTDKHSGKIYNGVGQVVKMDRSDISDDPNFHCHRGLHVGGLKYSGPNGWFSDGSDVVIIVKVNPKNVVCVPNDHNFGKMRVCEYSVVDTYSEKLKTSVYRSDGTKLFFAGRSYSIGDYISFEYNYDEYEGWIESIRKNDNNSTCFTIKGYGLSVFNSSEIEELEVYDDWDDEDDEW